MKAAGYKGLVIVIDEAETILRMRSDSRHKSLNGIRQIADAAGSYPGCSGSSPARRSSSTPGTGSPGSRRSTSGSGS